MTVTTKQITLFEQGWQGFYQGLPLYAVDSELYQVGWLAAWDYECELQARERGLK